MKISIIDLEHFPIWDAVKTFIISLFIAFILSLPMIYNNRLNNSLSSLIKTISNILINFGITFSAFIIIALSIIFLMDKKQWFNAIQGTKTFKVIIETFSLSIIFDLSCIFVGVISKLIYFNFPLSASLIKLIISINIFVLIYSILWSILCLKILKNMLTE
jgi:hypothetical protein